MKIIAFYLPQFHCIPENDEWWGKGFTEWTNTKKGKPNFTGHYQPHTPLNDNYYNLLDVNVQKKQIEMAKKYGVDGFCYYHYWFKNGKKLLEKPIENMLHNHDLDMPFCLCWANENWSRRWDGSENEVLMEQDYDDIEGWKDHYRYLSNFFHDERYIKIDGNPILIIYKPDLIDDLKGRLEIMNEMARVDGFNKLIFISQYPQFDADIISAFDYTIEFEPQYTTNKVRYYGFKSLFNNFLLFLNVGSAKILQQLGLRSYKKFSYQIVAKDSWSRKLIDNHFPGAFPNWDNTARKKERSDIYHGSTPDLFKTYIKKQLNKRYQDGSEPLFLFINAWNEWAEGAHLEPDEKYKHSYLEALRDAKNNL